MKMFNIKGQDIPVIMTEHNEEGSEIFATMGIINIDKCRDNPMTREEIVEKFSDIIYDGYQRMTKPIIHRSYDEYVDICTDCFLEFEKKLNVESKEIIHVPFVLDHLGWALDDYTIVLNSYMQYMEEEVIRYVIYHELCHLYTLKYNNSFEHNEDFYNILYKEYTPEEVARIKCN